MTTAIQRPRGSKPRGRRRHDGRFVSGHDARTLCEAVRAVTVEAAALDRDAHKDSRRVTTRAWNAARFRVVDRFGELPQAHEVCRQLRDRDGVPFAWRDLLELVFDETKDLGAVLDERIRARPRALDAKQVQYALVYIARRLGVSTVLPDQYVAERASVIEEWARRGRSSLASEMLPTRGQIEHWCGSWDAALETAGLDARGEPAGGREKKALPVPDAIAVYFRQDGCLPSKRALTRFCTERDISWQTHRGKTWAEWLTAAVQRIADLGLPSPPPYGEPAPDGWQPIDSELAMPSRRRRREYTYLEVLEWAHAFQANVEPGARANTVVWKAFVRARRGPSLGVVKKHGGLAALLDEVTRPDWRERAAIAEAEADTERQRAAEAALQERADAPDARAVLAVIDRREVVRAADLSNELGWSARRTAGVLRTLLAARRIERMHHRANARNQRYRRFTPLA